MNAELEPGTILNQRYEITRLIGRGNFGVVYEAHCLPVAADAHEIQAPAVPALVAIKQMPEQSIMDCERQADVRELLRHPAIPRIYDYFAAGSCAYLVSELVSGWDLDMVLERQKGFLPEKVVRNWAVQLCSFLDYLHTHPYYPMIFRDLKPSNLMVDRAGQIHAVDFGLVRIFPPGFLQRPHPPFEYLWKGLAFGTQGYSAPEQYDGFARPQSDIYALGATLHHLLTRRDPRKNPPFSFDKHPVRSLNPAISPAFEAIVMRAVDLDITRRYETAREMQAVLSSIMD